MMKMMIANISILLVNIVGIHSTNGVVSLLALKFYIPVFSMENIAFIFGGKVRKYWISNSHHQISVAAVKS
jgi:hypothetical protein